MTRMERLRAAARRLTPDRSHLAADLVAALTFAVVNVPQAMAHALLATVNPVLGIYTLMVAVPIGAIFSSSVFMTALPAPTRATPVVARPVAVAAGLVRRHHRSGPGRRRQPGHAQPRRPLP